MLSNVTQAPDFFDERATCGGGGHGAVAPRPAWGGNPRLNSVAGTPHGRRNAPVDAPFLSSRCHV